MREIKFRAWDGKEMRYLDQMFVGVGQIGFSDAHYVDLNSDYQEEAEIMQYTGLKDKNGKEIYEGDIMGLVHKKNGLINKQTVIWDSEAACFDFEPTTDDSWPDGFTGFIDEYEVIGNIYENKELLNA